MEGSGPNDGRSRGESARRGGVIVSCERIETRLDELAGEIAAVWVGEEVTVVGVMNGALFFLADLVRRLPMRVAITTVRARSYRGGATVPGELEIADGPSDDLAGRNVLIVDDVLDTGGTLGAVRRKVEAQGPASCRICVLLRKDGRPERQVQADFVGFDIPDTFVVGYGLDRDGWMRDLPDIVDLGREGHA